MKKETKKYFLTATLFFITAVIITLLIPVSGHYMQRYYIGEIWHGESLTAPFDYPVAKSEAEMINDRRELERNFIPVYRYDTAVFSASTLLAERMITETRLQTASERILKFIYDKGIIANLDRVSARTEEGLSFIRIDRNSVLEVVSTAEVFTLGMARQYFREQWDKLPVPDTLTVDESLLITPNVTFSESLTNTLRERELRNLPTTKGIVHENDVIVTNNQIINQEVLEKLTSLENEYEKRLGGSNNYMIILLGHFVLVLMVFLITFLFFYYFKHQFISVRKNSVFILLLYILMTGLCGVLTKNELLSVYIIPFAIVPVYILTFFDVRMSVYEHSTILLLCMLIVPKPTEFFFINFIAGIIAIFIINRSYRRENIFMAAGAILLSSVIVYLAVNLIQFGNFSGVEWINFVWFGFNAMLFLGMYHLLYVIEKIFGFVSNVTLLELCDTNQKPLLELARKAPGTFQHTLQVANLSEAAAKEIGANPLLARTGAMYHDIGKMNNPAYFIENTGGNFNPHDQLNPEESARIIRKHVSDGVALAQKYRLPKVITDFIEDHHGDSLIYYFYSKEKELEGGEVKDIDAFRYPGPRPVTKEVSICMMADAVEAASRSLKDNSKESIDSLVDKIIDNQIKEKELSHSLLSFNDISKIKEVFKSKLYNIHHTRIAYPEREES